MPTVEQSMMDRSSFAIKIDYVRGKGDATRPFRTIVSLIEAMNRFDNDLAKTVDAHIETVCVLEDVEASSIKVFLANALRVVDDTALKSGDWKKVVGDLLVKGKYIVLEKLQGKTTLTEPLLLDDIQETLYLETERTQIRGLAGYTQMSKSLLATHIVEIVAAMKDLEVGDKVTYELPNGKSVPMNLAIQTDREELTEILATRVVRNTDELILKVKKPDYLGRPCGSLCTQDMQSRSSWQTTNGLPDSAADASMGWFQGRLCAQGLRSRLAMTTRTRPSRRGTRF